MVAKSVEVDISVQGDTESKAKLDQISLKADELKKQFGPAYELKINAAAASQRMAVFRAQFKTVADAVTKAQDVQIVTAKAQKSLDDIRLKADKLRVEFPSFTAKIDTAEATRKLAVLALDAKATTDKINREIAGAGSGGILSRIPGFGGGSGAAGGAAGAASGAGGVIPAGVPLIGGMGSTGGIAAVGAALAALPFAAQAAAGGITFALGGALAGIAILGASKSKSVQDSFAALKTHATADLTSIGTSFVPVVNSILGTAGKLLTTLTPTFSKAAGTIAGPFKTFSDTLIKAFGQPAVQQSIQAVAAAFGKILTAATPGLSKAVGDIAAGVTKLANAVAANPKAFTDFIGFLAAATGGAITAVASLTRLASYIEAHFVPVFDGARHEIAHVMADILSNVIDVWNKIWSTTIGKAIQGGHNIESAYNSMKNAILVAIGAVKSGAQTTWNAIWANTVTRVQNGIADTVRFFQGLPGKVLAALGNAATTLYNWGSGVLTGMLNGIKSVWQSVVSFFAGLPKAILKVMGFGSPPPWSIQAGKDIMSGLGIGINAHLQKVVGNAKAAASAVTGALGGGGGPVSADAAAAQRYAQSRMGAYGWAANQMIPLMALWNQESGWNRMAYNASSGATGIPQALPYSKMPRAAWLPSQGGQASAGAQIDWGLSYIKSVYGSPAGAEAHEQAFNWYGSGLDAIFRRPTLIGVGEAGPEHVTVTPRGKTGGGMSAGEQAIVAALADLSRRVDNLAGVTASVPRATGQHVGAAIGGAAHDASFRRRYS